MNNPGWTSVACNVPLGTTKSLFCKEGSLFAMKLTPDPQYGAAPDGSSGKMYRAIFFTSLASLSFEVLLVRVFSIVLWYHFAFMVVSIAMFGLSVSGTAVASVWSLRRRRPDLQPWYFLLLGIAMAACYLIALRIPFDPVRLPWDRRQMLFVSLYYIILAFPFFLSGIIMASAFSSHGFRAGRIYASDLTGAAAGTLLILSLQFLLSPGQALFLCAGLSLSGSLLLGGPRLRMLTLVTGLLFFLLVVTNPQFIRPRMSPYKELPLLLKMVGAGRITAADSPYGRVDLFTSPGIRHAPGLSLRFRGEVPLQVGLAVDGSSISTISVPDSGSPRDFLDYLPTSLAFKMRARGDILLTDPRGGVPAHLAAKYGAESLDCTESNPAVLSILRSEDILPAMPCSRNALPGLGRNIIPGRGHLYDLIDLPLSGTLPAAGLLGGGEDYRLTVEAFEAYLNGLRDEGVLNISLFIAPPYRAELRLLTTVLAALEKIGVSEPSRHVVALRSIGIICLLVKRSPFDEADLSRIRKFTDSLWFDIVYYHGMSPDEANVHIRSRGRDLSADYNAIADPLRRSNFVTDYPFDLTPPVDDRPYFHDFLRLETLGEVYDLVDRKWDFFILEGSLQPLILVQATLLGALLLLLPARLIGGGGSRPAGPVLYFGFIGLGFMLVEVGMIQQMILPLEHPVHAVATVLFALLASSGLGSYLSREWGCRHLWKIALSAGILILVYLAATRFQTSILIAAAPYPLRHPVVFALLFPAGLLMGMLFPGGVRYLYAENSGLIPWAWAVNGFFSVLAPVIAVMLARRAGFSGVLLLGSVAYFGAALAGRSFCASPTIGTKRTPPI